MSALYKVSKENFWQILSRMAEKADVYVPYQKGERLSLELFDRERTASMEFGQIRQTQPVKTFLTAARKDLGAANGQRQTVVVGLKACDLKSLVIQDHAFASGPAPDPFYTENRKKLTIIASDCTKARETCFCLAMEAKPYPEKEFDWSLSISGEAFVVQVASQKGEKLFAEFKELFTDATDTDFYLREENRKKVTAQVRDFIQKRGTPDTAKIAGTVQQNFESPIWKDQYATCVECGACNLVCPTCHCFLLFDDKADGRPKRFMEWDACLYRRFARVAGGANPRKQLWSRLRNRFEKKFDFFPKVAKVTACTGCGRCIEACPGNIDIREVLIGLVTGKWKHPPHD